MREAEGNRNNRESEGGRKEGKRVQEKRRETWRGGKKHRGEREKEIEKVREHIELREREIRQRHSSSFVICSSSSLAIDAQMSCKHDKKEKR